MNIDAVVVLANLMDGRGRLNIESAKRAEKCVEIYYQTNAKAIITTGWNYRSDSAMCIGEAFRKHLHQFYGISHDSIIVDTNSRDTVGDAYFTKINIVEPRKWSRLAVVTSDYHASRSLEIFRFVYGASADVNVASVACEHSEDDIQHELTSVAAFRETFAGVREGDSRVIHERLREKHPFYNGLVYSKI